MDLHPGEQVVFEGHPSWRGVLSFYVKGLGIALAPAPSQGASSPSKARGAVLYGDACSSCHGEHLEGVKGRGPALRGVGGPRRS